MEARRISATRLRNLLLWGRPSKDPVEVVARLGALQSQEFPYALWSLGQRARGWSYTDIKELFDRGAILRTHVLRPTWHFVLPQDIRWMLRLTAPRIKKMQASYDRQLELDERFFARTNRLITKWLGEGTHLTRQEIIQRFRAANIEGTGQRFGHIVSRAELEGLICSGTTRGNKQTYALLAERAPDGLELDGEEALAELTRRYFETRGPATLKDYSWWASLRMSDCRRGVEMLGSDLVQREFNDRTYFLTAGTRPSSFGATRVDLVQAYDECIVSYTISRDALFADRVAPQAGLFWHPLLSDGQMAGHWRLRRQARTTTVEVQWSKKLRRDERAAFSREIDRYSKFLGEPLTASASIAG